MNTLPYESREEDWDSYDEELDDGLPGRPRRQFLNKWTALLFALIVGGVGFFVGIRVEKNQLSNSSGGAGLTGALASRFGSAGGGATAGGTGTTPGSSASTSGASAAGRSSGFAGRFGGAGLGGLASAFGGGSATIGTVSSVDGDAIYVQETSGNTVKVTLSSATKITKSEPVSKSKLYPGDAVVVAGLSNGKNGSVSATTVSDSGARSTGSTSGSGSSSSSGSSAIKSLF